MDLKYSLKYSTVSHIYSEIYSKILSIPQNNSMDVQNEMGHKVDVVLYFIEVTSLHHFRKGVLLIPYLCMSSLVTFGFMDFKTNFISVQLCTLHLKEFDHTNVKQVLHMRSKCPQIFMVWGLGRGERELSYMRVPLLHPTLKPWNNMHLEVAFCHWFDTTIHLKGSTWDIIWDESATNLEGVYVLMLDG